MNYKKTYNPVLSIIIMENKFNLAEDDNELYIICVQVWKHEKNMGLRSIQKITKKILIDYK